MIENVKNAFFKSLATNISQVPNRLKTFSLKASHGWLALKTIGILIGLLGLGVLGLFWAVSADKFGALPTEEELGGIQHYTASEVYSSDSVLLGRYYIENRTSITYQEISPYVIQGLLATEDARFYEHSGVDTRSLMRVGLKSILLRDESSGGGSTISQQLAKNLYPRRRYRFLSMPINKIREMIVARRLERVYSKEDILTLYLNTVPFGEKVYGIAAASQRFFNVSAYDLKVEEAAVLVGMLKATTSYNPRLYTERSLSRRNVVLGQMQKYSYLDQPVCDSLKKLPLELDYNYVDHNTGLAPYFREHLRNRLEKILEGTPYNLYTSGLKIYTSIDSKLQAYAEEAISSKMKNLQATFDEHWKDRDPWGKEDVIERAMRQSERYRGLKKSGLSDDQIQEVFNKPIPMNIFSWDGEQQREMSPMDSLKHYNRLLHTGFVAMEPQTGYVRAWVGGIDHKYFKYDHVKSHRQVGSTFKPIVYTAALLDGKRPCDYISNEREVYEKHKNWSPGNADGNYEGEYSLKGGLTKSVNTISVKLIMDTGPENVAKLAKALGISSELPIDPSIALGTADLSLYEMVKVYSTFANRGQRASAAYITSITEKDGKIIKSGDAKSKPRKILHEDIADAMIAMMQSVVDSGTAASLRYKYNLSGDLIGKTGTTQSHADGWFIGGTPKLVAGVWVGAEDRRVRFRSLSLGQGGRTALPIWAAFMNQIYEDNNYVAIRNAKFPRPSVRTQYLLDCPNYREEDPNERFWDFLNFSRKQRRENERFQQRMEEYELDPRNNNRPRPNTRKEGVFDRFKRKKQKKSAREEKKSISAFCLCYDDRCSILHLIFARN